MWRCLLALAVFVGGGLLGSYRGRIGSMTRDAVTWLALGLGLVTIYAYKDELMPIAARVVGELLPGSAMTVEQSTGGVTEVTHQEAARRAFHRHDQGERQVDLDDRRYRRLDHRAHAGGRESGRHRY